VGRTSVSAAAPKGFGREVCFCVEALDYQISKGDQNLSEILIFKGGWCLFSPLYKKKRREKGNVMLFHLHVHEQISFRSNFTVIMTISNGLDFQKYSL